MFLRFSIFVICSSIFTNLISLSKADFSNLNLYVDSLSTFTDKENPQEKHFTQLYDALNYISNEPSSTTQFNIYIAPRTESYSLGKVTWNFGATDIGALTISTWEGKGDGQSFPTLDFQDSSLKIKDSTLTLSKLNIAGYNGNINMENTVVYLENLNILTEFGEKGRLLAFQECANVIMKEINLNINKSFNFINYSFRSRSIPKVFVEKLNVIFHKDPNQEGESFIAPSLIYFSRVEPQTGQLNLSKVTVRSFTPKTNIHIKTLFTISGFQEVLFEDFNIQGQDFSFAKPFIGALEAIKTLTVQRINLNDNKINVITNTPLFRLKSITNVLIQKVTLSSAEVKVNSDAAFCFMDISIVDSMVFNFTSLIGNRFDGNVQFMRLSTNKNIEKKSGKLSPNVDNLIISDNNNLHTKSFFSFIVIQGFPLGSFDLTNAEFSKNHLSGRVFFFQNQYDQAAFATRLGTKFVLLNLRNIIIKDNLEARDISFLYLAPFSDNIVSMDCCSLLEPFTLDINNLTVINNKFSRGNSVYWVYEASFFQTKYTEILLKDSLFENNSLELYNFFKIEDKPSSVFLSNTKFINNKLNSSQFFNTNYRKTSQPCMDNSPNLGYKTKLLYRHTFIVSCSFLNNYLNSSIFFNLNNGFFVFSDNSLTETSLANNSKLISTTFSPIRLPPTSSGFQRDSTVEMLSLQYFASPYFQNNSEEAAKYQPSQTYFYSITSNNFNGIKLETSTLVSLKGYGFSSSFIRFENNEFEEVDASYSESASTIFTCEAFDALVIQHNRFKRFYGETTLLFSLPKGEDSLLLKVFNNSVSLVFSAKFLAYTGNVLRKFEFNENIFQSSTFSEECINIHPKISHEDYVIRNNIFSYVMISNDVQKLQTERLAFIHINVRINQLSSKLIFRKNSIDQMEITSTYGEKLPYEIHAFAFETLQPIEFIDNNIMNVKASARGSLIYITKSVGLVLSETLFSNIQMSSSTGLIATFNKKVLIYNSTFTSVKNNYQGGVLYLIPGEGKYSIKIIKCVFESVENGLLMGRTGLGTIFTSKALEGVELLEGDKEDEYKLDFLFEDSKVSMVVQTNLFTFIKGECRNCLLQDSSVSVKEGFWGRYESYLQFDGVSGDVLSKNVSFPSRNNNIVPYYNVLDSQMKLTIQDFIINGNQGYLYLVALNIGELIIKDSIFENLKVNQSSIIAVARHSPFYNSRSAEVLFENTTFRNIIGPVLSGNEHRNFLEMYTYQVDALNSNIKPAIFISGVPSVLNVRGCIFENIHNANVILFPASIFVGGFKTIINIEKSTFSKLSALMGPALLVLSQQPYLPEITITQSTFADCNAYIGGALSLLQTSLNMSKSTFHNIHAKLVGAVVFKGGYLQNDFFLEDNTFENTTSEVDNVIGTEASDFNIRFISNNPNGIEAYHHPEDTDHYIMKNVSSREFQAGYLELTFVDVNKQRAYDLSQSESIVVRIPKQNAHQTFNVFPLVLHRIDRFIGLVALNNITLSGQAHDTIELFITYSSSQFVLTYMILVTLRECKPGEFFTGLLCEPCKATTFSLHPSKSCTQCPDNAECQDHSKICPISGHWNANDSSIFIARCPDGPKGKCHSGKAQGESCRNCREGYTGPYCTACDFSNGYVESGYFECELCTNPQKSLIFTTLFALGHFIFQIFAIFVVYRGFPQVPTEEIGVYEKRKIERSFYMKSLITYGQLMSTICITSPQIFHLVGLSSQIGNPSFLIVYGTQCALTALGIDYNQFIYYQTYLVIAGPILQLPFIIFTFFILSFCLKSIHMKKVISSSIIYIIITYQPGIATTLAQFLSCTTIKDLGYEYIASHSHWSCNEPQYEFVSTFIVIPNLVLWCIVIPLFVLRLVRSIRSRLQAKNAQSSFGMLLTDLKEGSYYWGFVLMLLKLSTSMLIYGLETQPEVQIFSFLLLLWIYQSLVRIIHPYKEAHQNDFEIFITNLLIFNIIIIKCLLNTTTENAFISEISIIIGLIVNSCFILFILIKLLLFTFFNKPTELEEKFLKREGNRFRKSEELNHSLLSQDSYSM